MNAHVRFSIHDAEPYVLVPLPPARTLSFRNRRARIERAIEALIAYLDLIDGDPDLEVTFGHVGSPGLDECEPDHDEEDCSIAMRGGQGL